MFEFFSNIHFLRPWWFLALLPVAWIIWQAWHVHQKQGAWHQVIDPKFRKLLLGEDSSSEPSLNEKIGYFVLGFTWFFTVLALSGPWVKSVDVPAQKSQQGVVIVLDLSLSMMADDITPTRLARVKYTLTDLLKQNPEYAVGMVAYAGSAHTISPISDDNNTLLGLLPSLSPVVMPKFGSKPLLAFSKADELLKGAHVTHGHIIWITDDVETHELDQIESWMESHPYSLSLLTVGTEKGGVVQIPEYGLLKDDKGNLILPKVPLQRFAQLNDDIDMKWQHLQVGVDNTLELLPAKMSSEENSTKQLKKDVNHPLDIGFYFLFLLIPVVAMIFRRGTLLNLSALALVPVLMSQPQPVYADSLVSDLGNAFKSQDQQGYEAWEANEYEKAEALFNNKQWKASALYRQGKYSEAAKLFDLDKSAIGYFNKGNALANNMQLDEAIKAYEQALLIDPSLEAAKTNLNITKQLKTLSSSQNLASPDASEQNVEQQKAQSAAAEKAAQAKQAEQKESSTKQQAESNNGENKPSEQGDQQTQQGMETADNNGDQSQPPGADKQDKAATEASDQASDNLKSTRGKEADPSAKRQQAGVAESSSPDSQNGANETQNANTIPSKLASDTIEKQNNGEKSPLSEEELAQQNWLKQIPDEPGVFLKRKFDYQYQQTPQMDNENEKQW